MNVRAVFASFVSSWFGGLLLALVLIVPGLKLLEVLFRSVFWAVAAMQAIFGGAPLPDFWGV